MNLTEEQKRLWEAALKKKESEKALSLLGFAARAGKLVTGVDRICDEVRRHGVPCEEEGEAPYGEIRAPGIVIVAADCAGNTKKRLFNACRYYGIRLASIPIPSEKLAGRIGCPSGVAACATFDRHFASGLSVRLAESRPENSNERMDNL